jgi:hypothetical protein
MVRVGIAILGQSITLGNGMNCEGKVSAIRWSDPTAGRAGRSAAVDESFGRGAFSMAVVIGDSSRPRPGHAHMVNGDT